jgi:chromosomal replication initiation ATPase DnaA
MATELHALRAVDFDWALHLDSVWEDSDYHVPELHQSLRDEIVKELELRVGPPNSARSPLGWIIVGVAGSGKTHLLGALRQEIFAKDAFFLLVDMTDIHDFWETVLLGYVNSLQQEMPDNRRQYEVILGRLLGKAVKARNRKR